MGQVYTSTHREQYYSPLFLEALSGLAVVSVKFRGAVMPGSSPADTIASIYVGLALRAVRRQSSSGVVSVLGGVPCPGV